MITKIHHTRKNIKFSKIKDGNNKKLIKTRENFIYKLFKQPGDPKKPINLFMGSSSIGVFNLFTKNTNNLLYKFKGATAKGLLTNDNGKDIMKVLEEYKKRKIRINCIVMHFGEVDLNFSYFFKSLQNIQAKAKDDWYIPYRDFCDSILTPYKEFLNKVFKVSHCKRLVIKGVYPNPLADGNKKLQLVNYAIMQPEEVDKLIPSTLTKKFEEMMRKYYNTELRKGCNGKMYDKMYYYDLDEELLEKDGMKVKDEYCDLSKVNIHLRWEPLVKLHLNKLMKLGLCGITKNDVVDEEKLKANEKDYLEYKKQKLQEKGLLESNF